MDILQNFGIDPLLLTAQVVNFLIIFWLLKRFAYKPIFGMLKKRQKQIEDGIENAKLAEASLQKAQEEEKEIIKKARDEARNLLLDAKVQAQSVVDGAQEKAKIQVAKMLEDGQRKLQDQLTNSEKTLSKHAAELAVKLLEKSLASVVSEKEQKEIVIRATKKLVQ